ncbi:MAG: enolase C-terminal domain-like protein [Rhodospirillales bacterium]
MRIVDIRTLTLDVSENRSNAIMDFSEMTLGLCAVVTDVVRGGRPVVGYGFSALGRYSQEPIWRDRLIPRIMKADPESLLNDAGDTLDPKKIWAAMTRNEKDGGHGDRAVAVAGIDIAVWDACAKIADKPAAAVLADASGNTARAKVPVYVGGGYYSPGKGLKELQDEMHGHHDAGFTMLKMKIGGAPIEEDMKRIEAVLEVQPNDRLMVDANAGLGEARALDYAKAMAPYKLRWYEDPGSNLDFGLMAEICEIYPHGMATGEDLMSFHDCRNLMRFGGMRPDKDFFLFDPSWTYGPSEYMRIVAMMADEGWSRERLYPHGGHLVSLHVTAGLGLGGTEAYPTSFQPVGGFTDGLDIADGLTTVPDLPGFGFEGKANLIAGFEKLTEDLPSRKTAAE